MRHCHPVTAITAAAVTALAACSDPFALPTPAFPNVVDTVSLYALHGTAIALPSGYRLDDHEAVRTDQATGFDFAFDIDTAGNAVLLPTRALDLGPEFGSGAQITAEEFDSILVAPTRDYQLDSAVVVAVGDVVLIQSRQTVCSFGIPAFYYAKLEILGLETTSGPNGRRLDFHILVDRNCGYRGLEPGLPDR